MDTFLCNQIEERFSEKICHTGCYLEAFFKRWVWDLLEKQRQLKTLGVCPESNVTDNILWETADKGLTPSDLLRIANTLHESLHPCHRKLLRIMLILPTHTADVERGFSAMGRVKTKLRSRLEQPNLDRLLRVSIEGPPLPEFPFHRAVEKWLQVPKFRKFDQEMFKKIYS